MENQQAYEAEQVQPKPPKERYWLYLLLFVLTLLTTTLTGAEWIYGRSFIYGEQLLGWAEFWAGLHYSLPFLGILTAHEFGHYFMARYYRLSVSLPFYIPFWLGFLLSPSMGTMGAFIRIRERIHTAKEFFDVGIAGPLAGFVVALGVLWYGFAYLPPAEYIYQIHPEYEQYGLDYAQTVYKETEGNMRLGSNLIFEFFKTYVASDAALVPNDYEIIHYPYLFAGYLALFFTALNLIPIGQLDGGHILYGLIGYHRHRCVSLALFVLYMYYAGLGMFHPATLDWEIGFYVAFLFFSFRKTQEKQKQMNVWLIVVGIIAAQMLTVHLFPTAQGYQGWLLFGFIIGNFLGVYHPPATYQTPLDTKRKILGWIALIVFVLCFSPQPFIFE